MTVRKRKEERSREEKKEEDRSSLLLPSRGVSRYHQFILLKIFKISNRQKFLTST